MNLIGFIKEYNNIQEASNFKAVTGETCNDPLLISKTINYLNNGTLVLAWMGYFFDLEDSNIIAPDCYYTDGVYVWPAYFSYYLKKNPNYIIEKEFLSYLSEKNFQCRELKDLEKNKLEKKLSKKLNPIAEV